MIDRLAQAENQLDNNEKENIALLQKKNQYKLELERVKDKLEDL